MALIPYVVIKDRGKNPHSASGVKVVEWLNVSEDDTCKPITLANYVDKTIQVSGDWGVGGVCIIEGAIDSAEETSPTYETLADPQGNNIAIAVADKKIETVLENTVFLRPRVTGSAVLLNIRLVAATPR